MYETILLNNLKKKKTGEEFIILPFSMLKKIPEKSNFVKLNLKLSIICISKSVYYLY